MKKEIVIIIIGIVICWTIDPILSLIETVVVFATDKDLLIPLSQYILYGYSSAVICGIYIAQTTSDRRVLLCLIVGVIYSITRFVFYGIYGNNEFMQGPRVITLMNVIAHYSILISGSCTITYHLMDRRRL